jgi:hypothetical protein
MNASTRLASLALAGLLTVATLFGIDHLATSDMGRGATIAAANAPRA